jgi:CRP/FNR family transcriptional regulator
MSKTSIRSIKISTLKDYCRNNPQVYKELFYITGTRLNLVIAHSETMSLGNSYRSLAHKLAYYADQFGQVSDEGIKLLVPLTNSDLASVMNISRETVSRSFSRLQQKGLVKSGKNIIIPDVEKLRREAY